VTELEQRFQAIIRRGQREGEPSGKPGEKDPFINPMLEDGGIEAKCKNVPNPPLQGYRTVAGTEVGE